MKNPAQRDAGFSVPRIAIAGGEVTADKSLSKSREESQRSWLAASNLYARHSRS